MKTLNAFFESERFTATLNLSSASKLNCFIIVSSLWFNESKFPIQILGKLRSLTTVPRKSVRSADPRNLSSRVEPTTCSLAVVMTIKHALHNKSDGILSLETMGSSEEVRTVH